MKKFSKRSRRDWWRSLTLDEQVEYVMDKMEEQGKIPDYNKIYSQLIEQNNYLK